MTRAVGDDQAMMQSLVEVADLFEKAQTSIFKLMASVSLTFFFSFSCRTGVKGLTQQLGLCTEVYQALQIRPAAERP